MKKRKKRKEEKKKRRKEEKKDSLGTSIFYSQYISVKKNVYFYSRYFHQTNS